MTYIQNRDMRQKGLQESSQGACAGSKHAPRHIGAASTEDTVPCNAAHSNKDCQIRYTIIDDKIQTRKDKRVPGLLAAYRCHHDKNGHIRRQDTRARRQVTGRRAVSYMPDIRAGFHIKYIQAHCKLAQSAGFQARTIQSSINNRSN